MKAFYSAFLLFALVFIVIRKNLFLPIYYKNLDIGYVSFSKQRFRRLTDWPWENKQNLKQLAPSGSFPCWPNSKSPSPVSPYATATVTARTPTPTAAHLDAVAPTAAATHRIAAAQDAASNAHVLCYVDILVRLPGSKADKEEGRRSKVLNFVSSFFPIPPFWSLAIFSQINYQTKNNYLAFFFSYNEIFRSWRIISLP